ncbi:MAG: sporulation transcriptional regulator SpoIIID [Clostridia bacterium]|nr:sporulation transcriptional regulator SpoIIID [Clostridia bacterium]
MQRNNKSLDPVRFERERSVILGEYISRTGATVRQTAKKFGISKSTVHKDVTEKLQYENRALYNDVKEVLTRNKAERHLRGGEATKEKYREKRLSQK